MDDDGYLLPQYWRCLACQGRKRATYALKIQVLRSVIDNDRILPDLEEAGKTSVREWYHYAAHPAGAALERPAGTEHLEDTTGLARDSVGIGFDAVYLCDAHLSLVTQAIEDQIVT